MIGPVKEDPCSSPHSDSADKGNWQDQDKENKNNHNYISAAEQLAALLSANSINVIRTSFYKSKLLRLIDTVYSIIKNNAKIEIAIVPLYGTRPSFIWQEIATRALKLFRKKIILIVHGGSIPQRMEINAAPFLKSLRRANVAVCPSAYLQQYLKQHGVNTLLIENVLDLSAYTFCMYVAQIGNAMCAPPPNPILLKWTLLSSAPTQTPVTKLGVTPINHPSLWF